VHDLKHALGASQVTQGMLAEVEELDTTLLDQLLGG
jgi:hypothetical protein